MTAPGSAGGVATSAVWPEPLLPGQADVDVAHVVAWNLTRRCNLACAHCYISAGSWEAAAGELDTPACLRIVDQILEASPSPLLILSGGEPLVRDDLEAIAGHATRGGATVVVGTNGTGLSENRIDSLMRAGVQGVAVSIDSLNPRYHDRFRHGEGSLEATVAAIDRLAALELDFLVQTTVTRGNRAEIANIAAWACRKGAVCLNIYFLVETGRGEDFVSMSRLVADSPAPPLYGRMGGFEGNVDRWQVAVSTLPAYNTVHAGCAPAGAGGADAPTERKVEFFNLNAMTPETETTTHYFYAHARSFALEDEAMDESFRVDFRRVFGEDISILGAQQANIGRRPDASSIDIKVDGPGLAFRRMLAQRIEEEGRAGRQG